MLLNILEELHSTLQLPAINGLRSLAGVLERYSQVGTAGTSRLGRVDLGGSVSNLKQNIVSSCSYIEIGAAC